MIRIQIALVYLDAATKKFRVQEWRDGTILWYVFNDPVMGCNNIVRPLVTSLIKNSITLPLMAWSAIGVELLLFLGLDMDRPLRKKLLVLGIAFHFVIIFLHGLITFFCATCAGLILYLRPWDEIFYFGSRAKHIKPLEGDAKIDG